MRTLRDRFSIYFHGLKAAVASNASMPRPRIAFLEGVWRYLLSLSFRLDLLVKKWQDGTLRKPRPPSLAPRPARPRASQNPRPAPAYRLPRGHQWLLRRVLAAGPFGGQLRHLLANDADLRAFLKAAPQARRLLNPLCGMFGLTLPAPPAVDSVPPLDLAQAQPAAEPESAANPPPLLADDSSRVAPTAPDPPFVFSSP